MTRAITPLEERFFRYVSVPGRLNQCWVWTGAISSTGYGAIGRGRRDEGIDTAHRVSYELFIGPVPEGMHIDHTCNVRSCVNPLHLEAVTQAENNRRIAARGRDCGPAQAIRDEIVRRRLAGEPRDELAAEYGLHPTTISVYVKKHKEGAFHAHQ